MGDAGGSGVGGSGRDADHFGRRFNEELAAYTPAEINRLIQRALQPQQPAVPRPIFHQGLVDRNHVGAHKRLYEDYFAPEPRHDAAGRPGHTPIQKCTAAIRQLAYGAPTDMWDEYLHIGETIASNCLKHFYQCVIEILCDQYLRKPTPQDCQDLMQMQGDVHGFPEMLGSIDCMHWEWKNCPAS
ncbi:uncharacterized protein LOC125195104 [Salvia hispanica]|uniref:uncharacterized protein LOC125195104 n=1 Tax=Salvia hispanica TaxID=49212 RepID=UPI0020096D30|nr:uncharacterized protein LOC125195104 [Salvia hispanica]